MITIMSLWRNDADRDLEARAEHLLAKTSAHHELRWLWITGDNSDETCQRLGDVVAERMKASAGPCPVTIIDADSGIVGEDVPTRRRRGSVTASEMFRHIDPEADFVLLHESDLRSDIDVIDQFLDSLELISGEEVQRCGMRSNRNIVAGWPEITLNGCAQFYQCFLNAPQAL